MSDRMDALGDELRLLAEAVLERIEPQLRGTAAGLGKAEWASCSWCPACAAAALIHGEHHDVLAALADHGTALVTVLREAIAGVPVEPRLPPEVVARQDVRSENAAPEPPAEQPEGPSADSPGGYRHMPRTAPPKRATASSGTKHYVHIPVTIKV